MVAPSSVHVGAFYEASDNSFVKYTEVEINTRLGLVV